MRTKIITYTLLLSVVTGISSKNESGLDRLDSFLGENFGTSVKKIAQDELLKIKEIIENESSEIDSLIGHMDTAVSEKVIKTEAKLDAEIQKKIDKFVEESLPSFMDEMTKKFENSFDERVTKTIDKLAKNFDDFFDDDTIDNITSTALAKVTGTMANKVVSYIDEKNGERIVASYFFDPEEQCSSACMIRRSAMDDSNEFCNSKLIKNNNDNNSTDIALNILRRNATIANGGKVNQMKVKMHPNGSYYCESIETKTNCSDDKWIEASCEKPIRTLSKLNLGRIDENDVTENTYLLSIWTGMGVILFNLSAILIIASGFSYVYLYKRNSGNQNQKSQQKSLLAKENRRFTTLYQQET